MEIYLIYGCEEMFNDYIWQNYLNSGGKETAEDFKNAVEDFKNLEKYADKIAALHKVYCPSKYLNQSLKQDIINLFNWVYSGELPYSCYELDCLPEGKEYTINDIITIFYKSINQPDEKLSESRIFEEFSAGIEFYTTFIFLVFPEIFIPYYFRCNFNVLEKIAGEFEIKLPVMPVKKDYKGRFFYYGELCQVFYDFRMEHNMSPYEFCAFLYDFAPKYIGGVNSYIINNLPSAKGAYFIGGAKGDEFLSDENDIITPWQCNPETMAGDNIVMYLKYPISAVDSIWRSVSIGFNDPFFYFYRWTYIAKPVKINRVSQKQLQNDSLFKDIPIVRKNMQGINGVELYPKAYNHLLDIACSDLPKLVFLENIEMPNIQREKDVENNLIKPFLNDLGYSEDSYIQQLYIEIGNHNHAFLPYFVINPKIADGHKSAEFIIEAKFSVASKKEFDEYKKQARSYANQLKAKYSVIASKEGIWISSETDDYSRDFIVLSWAQLKNPDNFHNVKKFLGYGNVIKSSSVRIRLTDRASEFLMFSDD